uniref:Galectin n=1 Tax=Syphacia muris TaxID=451379 RepID=A0A0N5AN32_9BILA
PSGKQKRAGVFPIDQNTFKVEWKAFEAGEHFVDVKLFDQSVYESPFICNVGDPDLVSVRSMPEMLSYDSLNKEESFEIDASAAGSGNLEIIINGGRIPCRVRSLGSRKYLAMFTPTQPVPHIVEMSFNNEHVRMSPWSIPFIQDQRGLDSDSEQQMFQNTEKTIDKRKPWYTELSGLGLQRAAVNKPATFEISGEGLDPSLVAIKLYDPDGNEVPVECYQSDAKLICEYVLQQVIGEHRLETVICGKKIDPYPLIVSGYSAEKVKIEPLRGSTPGRPVQFVGKFLDCPSNMFIFPQLL